MSLDDAVRTIKIFVSSPVDVASERGRVQAVAAKLNRDYEGLVRFDTALWEEHFYKADRSFQPQIQQPEACDILVSVFWARVGTELPADFARMPNGKPYPSGTAYELLTALEASKKKGVPDVYVFRKTADAALPTADRERRRQAQTQFDALEAFWSEWFKSDQGQFKAAFQTFSNTDDFECQIEELLRQWLDSRRLLGPRLKWSKEKGSPFPGLAPFEVEHAAVFFGRDRAIDEARRRLVAAAENATPFLLIVGASGSGKSSLTRAGLIPRLTTPGIVAAVDLWRTAIMKPSEGQAGPVASMARALFAALPELAQGDFPTAAALADNLQRGGAAAARPILGALTRAGEAAQRERHSDQPRRPALVLLVDQLEELFAQAVGDDERAAFSAATKELVATGDVWCIATLRADLYEFMLKQPTLKALKEAGQTLDLGPPAAAELAEIVRAPAAAAGLLFEMDSQKGALDERLLDDAKTADSLPLLQFTLRHLYERRVQANGETRLTHAVYEALGGLQGAIAAEAERAVAKLPTATLDALPRLLRRLAEPARDDKTLTLREVAQADVTVEPTEAALVDALLGARILVARQDATGRPTLRLAHDAVLTGWSKAQDAAQASREFYRVRAEAEDALRRWRESGRPKDRLIQHGVPLAEAEKLVADFARELPPELIGFVSASRHQARARQRLLAASAMFFFVLAVVATGAGIWAYRAQQQALAERSHAETSYAAARQTVDGLIFNIVGGLGDVEGMRTDALVKILDTARQTVEKLAANYPADLALQHSRASMLSNFGNIYHRNGDITRGLPVALDALAIYRKLVAAEPGNAQWQRELGSALFIISTLQIGRDNPAALQAAEENLAIRRRLAELDGVQYQVDLAQALQRLQILQVTVGDMIGARKSVEESLAIYRRLTAQSPGDASLQRGLAESLSDLALLMGLAGDLEGNSKLATEAQDALQKLDPGDPAYAESQRRYARGLDHIGDLQLQKGDMEAARKSYEESEAVRERLAKQDPQAWRYQDDIADSLRKIGDLKQRTGDRTGAYKSYQDGIKIRHQLLAHNPANYVHQNSLAGDLESLVKLQIGGGDPAAAMKTYQEIIEIRRKIAVDSSTLPGLAMSLRNLADLQLQMGDRKAAKASLAESVEVLRRSYRDPSNAMFRGGLIVVLNQYGSLLRDMGDMDGAHKAFDESLRLSREQSAGLPDQKIWSYVLATTLDYMGKLQIATNDTAGALKTYQEALAVDRRLTAAEPDRAEYRTYLWSHLDKVGDLEFAGGENDQAHDAWGQSVAVIRRALAMHDPSADEHTLAIRLGKLANLDGKIGRIDDAHGVYRDLFEILRRHVDAEPAAASWSRLLAAALQDFGDLEVTLNAVDQARAAFQESCDIRRKLLAVQPSDSTLEAELGVSHDRLGNALVAQGKLKDAVVAYRSELDIAKRLIAQDPSNAQWISQLGGLAYRFVLARDFARALEAADQAISLAPDQKWMYVNRAHALMFLRRTDEAHKLYLKYRGEKDVLGGKSWEADVLEDFTELRNAGLTDPLMHEIEKEFAAKG
jgi:tetratricopeptide (TPR) repeat protein